MQSVSTKEAALVAEVDRLIAENVAMAASLTQDNNYLRRRLEEFTLEGHFYQDDRGFWREAGDPISFPGCTQLFSRAQHAAP